MAEELDEAVNDIINQLKKAMNQHSLKALKAGDKGIVNPLLPLS